MKYYYGNTYKEALGNPPIDIQSDKQLQSYLFTYEFVIPVDNVLPDKVSIQIDSCVADNINDDEWMQQYINDYLSDNYGFLVEHCCYEIKDDKIEVTHIYWDTSY